MRTAEITRSTSETKIQAVLNLDGEGKTDISTGIGFFDHMLTLLAFHACIDLKLHAQGDLEVDAHHTVEDCALVLGRALDHALGERKGITRMGFAYVPMDEVLGRVVVDLSGRPYTVFRAEWTAHSIGVLPTTLFEHFFQSLAVQMRANLHAEILYGLDDHHKAEALFKALGRSLRVAMVLDKSFENLLPSTKGAI